MAAKRKGSGVVQDTGAQQHPKESDHETPVSTTSRASVGLPDRPVALAVAAMRAALAQGLDAHWLRPVVLGKAKSGKAPKRRYSKRPVHTAADAARLEGDYTPGDGLGMRCGLNRIYVLEGDPPAVVEERKQYDAELLRLLSTDGRTLPLPTVISGSGGMHWHVLVPEDTPPLKMAVLWKGSGDHEEIRLLGYGSNAVLPPTLHYSGASYMAGGGGILDAAPALLDAAHAASGVARESRDTEAEALDLDSLPDELSKLLERAGQAEDRSRGIYEAICVLRERGYTRGSALWLIADSGLPFCSKVAEQGRAWAEGEVRRVWEKNVAKKQQQAAADFAGVHDTTGDDDHDDLSMFALPQMPDEALYGVLWQIVDAATANSEATRPGVAAAAMAHFAARFGKALGLDVGDDKRSLSFYALVVGPTGKGRKGTAAAFARQLFEQVDRLVAAGWGDDLLAGRTSVPPLHTLAGVSSGQGLIEQVRDDGAYTYRGVERLVPGVDDKRLLLELSEFGAVFSMAAQESSTLSMVLRDAFDGRPLASPTRSNPLYATGAHICMLGHITMSEFRRRTIDSKGSTEAQNGLLNRCAVLYSQRDRLVSRPEPVPDATRNTLAATLANNVHAVFGSRHTDHRGHRVVTLQLADEAKALWDTEYARVTTMKYDSDFVAAMMGRREMLTLVIAALLSAMNGESVVGVPALRAALAWGEYVATTNTRVFSTLEQRKKTVELARHIEQLRARLQKQGGAMELRGIRAAFSGSKFTEPQQDAAIQAMVGAEPPAITIVGKTVLLVGYVG